MTPLIEATKVAFSYGQQSVLTDINMTIMPGEIVGLIGENGAGKTTLLNLLLGIKRVQQGHLKVFGQAAGSLAARLKIGSMMQGDMAIQGVTVRDMLRLAAAQRLPEFDWQALLATLKLQDIAQQRLTALSGGQLRRVTFALALVGDPDLLFLDEPTVGMDTNAQQTFWQQIRRLKAAGKTIIITSHYLPEIEAIADRIVLLKDGRFVFQGSFAVLQKQYQQVEIRCQTRLPADRFTNLTAVTAVTKQGDELRMSSEDGDATLQAMMPIISELHQVSISRESLTDIFVHLTKGVSA
ncbi:ABC transporter ATP-binding protein [Lactiplantibacillus plantarum]|uniref:ABC transporter ATP-binding protein n=1 Tax=Lactiplantibacillus plantarum TaxID=1590 RepID=UPI0007B55C8B|nr:ABC transporter ATP-binding protein [Lactiplantibacillus plantarum]AZN83228.1 ABC transporter ATP-binding protein [Lactiplantibacillus plantarum subsp. plantarum]KZU60238.1 ABC transporter ATP-binding protein [Lactiplantibacillus plantarum]MCT3242896.1 ABC transporter ATP-binding protein [Lactiplantibacillus plantarum]WND26898.1 ABC transporter ATP-binding protein [Lactiplantibacillus plantarum]